MRVLIVTNKTRAWTSPEGMLLRHLPGLGVAPAFATAEPGPLADEARARGIPVTVLPALRDPRTGLGMLRLPYAAARLAALARRHRADLIHSVHGSTTPATLLASRLARVPHVCQIQFIYTRHSKFRKLWLHRARTVVGVARAQLEAFAAACPDRRAVRTAVVYCAIDADEFAARAAGRDVRAELGIAADALAVVMVGSLDARKDPQALIRAAGRLAAGGRAVELLLVGPFRSAEYAEATRALAAAAPPGVRCHFTGFQPNPSPFVRAADVVALPSWGEAFPISLLEGMAHGKPVVATPIGGIPEMVQDGVNGLLVPPGDDEALAGALGALLADPERRRAMGEQGRRRVLTEFSAEAAARRFRALYEACLNDG